MPAREPRSGIEFSLDGVAGRFLAVMQLSSPIVQTGGELKRCETGCRRLRGRAM
jgi:hypothetical protein